MWHNRYPVETSGNTMSEQIPCFDIKKEYIDVYIQKLNDEKYIILSANDYYLLTGQILSKKYGLAVRGITSHSGGSFKIYKNFKNELYVMSYANDYIFYNKTVLIIEIDELPEDVYNDLPAQIMF